MYVSVSVPIENILGGKRKSSGFRNLNTQLNTDFDGSHQLNVNSSVTLKTIWWTTVSTQVIASIKTPAILASVGGYLNYESGLGGISPSASATFWIIASSTPSPPMAALYYTVVVLTFTNNSFSSNDTLVLINAPVC